MRSGALLRALVPLVSLGATLALTSEAPVSPNAPDPEAAALIESVEAYHQSLPHFEARFEQRFSPRIFGRDRVESGRLTVKRPAQMRWDYEEPETKVFVSDGNNTWFHVPADQQVVVGAFGSGGESTEGEAGGLNPLELLTGDATILDHFDALLGDDSPASGLRTVTLVPRQAGGEITSLSLTVSAESGQIQGIESEDLEGNRTTFRFTDFRFATSPADSLFTFTIPPGTDVVTASDLRP
ncbi:MAG: outer membrane lipoprotein carrier protein LolA [Acidobacteria bacterium]|nr:outer membrane lipoprotein carrier protein LolA [Acidobacteriota bacterium]